MFWNRLGKGISMVTFDFGYWNFRVPKMAKNSPKEPQKGQNLIFGPKIKKGPFTPKGWLCSASNFGKTCLRWSPTFHLSTLKKNRATFSIKSFVWEPRTEKLPVLEELWFFGRNMQMRLEKWPLKFWFSALYDFWQRGESGTHHFWSWLFCQKLLSHLLSLLDSKKTHVSWLEDISVLARGHICPG